MKELHQVKISVRVNKVNINIKFPCSIKIQLKTGILCPDPQSQTLKSKSHPTPTHQKMGNVNPMKIYNQILNAHMTHKNQLIKLLKYFSSLCIKVTVLAIISSSNSNFPAGNVLINPLMYSEGDQIQKIELLQKCSDRQAKLALIFSYKMIKKIRQIQQKKSLNTVYNTSNRVNYTKTNLLKGIQTLQFNNNRQRQEKQKSIQKSEVDQIVTESRVRTFGEVSARPFKDYVRDKDKNKNYANQSNQRRQNALKGQVQMLSLEVEKYKQKIKNFERKQRQFNLIIKDLKDNVQKKKMKFMQSQSSKSSIEMNLVQKQKSIKELKQDIKRINQKMEDLKIQNNRLEKKIQIKQKSYNEQLKMFTEKIGQLEKQISKKNYESNSLLQKMQISQKNSQLSSKQRQKLNLQQKNRLLKKIQQLSQQIQHLNQSNESKQTKIQNMSSQLKSLSQQNSNRTILVQKLQSEIQILKSQLKIQKENKSSLEKEIELLLTAETDKNIFKKKYNQTSQILNKLNEKYQRATLNLSQSQTKLNEFQQKNKQLTKNSKHLHQQITNLNIQLQNQRKQNSNLSNQYNSLSAKHLNLTQKLNDTKSKLDSEKQVFEQMQAHYEDKLNYVTKSKEYVQNESEDWKEKSQKLHQMNVELELKCRTTNDDLLILHKETLQSEQANKKLKENIQDLQTKINRLNLQIQSWQRKQRQLQQSVKTKGNDLYDLQRKLSFQQQQIYILNEKAHSLTKSNQQLSHLIEKNVEDKDKQLNLRLNEFEELKNQHRNLQQLTEKLTLETINRRKQILIQQDQIKEQLQTIDSKNNKILVLESLSRQNKSRILALEEELTRITHNSLQTNQHKKQLDSTWSRYRDSTKKALEQFIDQICQDSCRIDVQLLKFEDSSLQTMQMTALKFKNQMVSKYRSRISTLEENIQFYKKQIQKIKQLHQVKQNDLDIQLVSLQNKITELKQKHMEQKQQLSQCLVVAESEKEETIIEQQKLKSTISKLQEIIEELTEQKQNLQNDLENSENQTVLLKEEILQMKSNSIKQKSNVEGYFQNYKQQTIKQIQNYKKNQSELAQKLLSMQKDKQIQQNQSNELCSQIQSLTLQLQQQTVKRTQSDNKLKQLQRDLKQLKSNLSTKQKLIIDLNDNCTALKVELKAFLDKILLLETQRKQLYEQLTQTTVKKEHLSVEIISSKEQINKLKAELSNLEFISLSSTQTKTSQIKQQKDTITRLESQIQLKVYIISQLQKIKQTNHAQIKQLHSELEIRKQQIISLNKQIENMKNLILKLQQSTNNSQIENEIIKQENSINIEKIIQLEIIINELTPKAEQLIIKIQQMQMMRQGIIQLQSQHHKLSLEYKSANNQVKNLNTKIQAKEQDYRKKIQSLEYHIQQKQAINKQNTQKYYSDWQKQKSSLIKQLQDQDKLLREQQQQNKFRIQQLEEQRNSLNAECEQLSYLCDEKDEEIQRLIKQYEDSQNKISELNLELKACLQAWDKEKLSYLPSRKQVTDIQQEIGRFQQYATEIDSKTKQLIQISRRKSTQQSKFGISDVIKDLSSTILKSKTKMLNKIESQQEKESIIIQYKMLQQKLDNALRSSNILYK